MSHQMLLQDFDREDPSNIGRPAYFNVEKYLGCVEEMITSDEVQFALDMLERMPGWFRDNPPRLALAIKERLLKQFFTTIDYAKNGEKIALTKEALKYLEQPHGQIVLNKCKELNEKGIAPHIEELAPGNYWLPLGLKEHGIKFTYFGPSLNAGMQDRAQLSLQKVWQESPHTQCRMFVCFEMIEHMKDPSDIYHHAIKRGGEFDVVIMSTPKYTYGGGMGEWHSNDLGHLRTYTPKEFGEFAMKYWPRHSWVRFDSHVMCLVGELA
jgi:hypothetical protein